MVTRMGKATVCNNDPLKIYYAQKMNDAYEFGTVDPTNLLLSYLNPADLDDDVALDYIDSGLFTDQESTEILDERFVLVPSDCSEMCDDQLINSGLLRFQPIIGVSALAEATFTVTITDVQVDVGIITNAGAVTILATGAMTRNVVETNAVAYERHSRSRIIQNANPERQILADTQRVYMDVRIFGLVSGGAVGARIRLLCGRDAADTYLIIPLI